MEQISTPEKYKKTPFKGCVDFIKRHKLILGILTGLIAVVCIVCAILQGNQAKEIKEYLNGKTLMITEPLRSGDRMVYSFNDGLVSKEFWDTSEASPSGDLSSYKEYKVSVSGSNVEIDFDGGYLVLLWDSSGYPAPRGEDWFYWYETGEFDITYERNDFFCDHEYVTEVIREATCTASGEERKTCTICGVEKTDYPVGEHSYEYNKCTLCGERRKSKLDPDTWHTHLGVSVLQYQNCLIESASVSGNAVLASYYMVCSHCLAVDSWLQLSAPELGYQASKLHTCDECGKITTVKLKVES